MMNNIDFVNAVKQLGIQFTDHGRYIKFKCINPSHNDQNPSMTMLKNNGFCKCWSCGVTYSFNQFIERVSGKTAKEYLGLSYYSNLISNKNKKKERKPSREFKLLEGHLYKPQRSLEVMRFLNSININKELIEEFDIRYTEERGKATFIKTDKKGTYIGKRICIPIIEDKKIINMECRDYTGKQNIKVIYPKGSRTDTLWNIDNLNFDEPLFVVEGIKSALRIYRYISKNVTATFGSALSNYQKELISKMKKAIIFPDNDEAGRSMFRDIYNFMEHDFKVLFMREKDEDPADNTLNNLKEIIKSDIIDSRDYMLKKYNISKRKLCWSNSFMKTREL